MKLSDATAIYSGDQPVNKIMLGSEQVWSAGPTLYYQWDGPEPGLELNPEQTYTMGTVIEVYEPITIHGVRIFGHPGSDAEPNRKAHLWDAVTEDLITDVSIDESPWSGWKNFFFNEPVAINPSPNRLVIVSYTATGGNAVINDAFNSSTGYERNLFGCWMISSDNLIGSYGLAPNGRTVAGADNFPSSHYLRSFWGVDILFST